MTTNVIAKKESQAMQDDPDPSQTSALGQSGVEPSQSVIETRQFDKVKKSHSLLHTISNWVKSGLGIKASEGNLKETLEEIIEEHEEKEVYLGPEAKVMMNNILSFGELQVRDVMTPRTQIIALECSITLPELLKTMDENGHTRMPVYRKTLDDVIGFIHVKDVFKFLGEDKKEFNISEIMRDIIVIPPSMRVVDLLLKMRKSGQHLALIVDEYGGTDGLVTLEDLFEEIVGDIQDEHDDEEDERDGLIKIADNIFEANARIEIEDLEEKLGINIYDDAREDQNFDTLGGLIFTVMGRLPNSGEKMNYDERFTFEIIDADQRKINKVRIFLSEPEKLEESGFAK